MNFHKRSVWFHSERQHTATHEFTSYRSLPVEAVALRHIEKYKKSALSASIILLKIRFCVDFLKSLKSSRTFHSFSFIRSEIAHLKLDVSKRYYICASIHVATDLCCDDKRFPFFFLLPLQDFHLIKRANVDDGKTTTAIFASIFVRCFDCWVLSVWPKDIFIPSLWNVRIESKHQGVPRCP